MHSSWLVEKKTKTKAKAKFYAFTSQLNTQFKCLQGCNHGAPVVLCFVDSPVSPASPASNHELQTEYLKMARKGGGHSGTCKKCCRHWVLKVLVGKNKVLEK